MCSCRDGVIDYPKWKDKAIDDNNHASKGDIVLLLNINMIKDVSPFRKVLVDHHIGDLVRYLNWSVCSRFVTEIAQNWRITRKICYWNLVWKLSNDSYHIVVELATNIGMRSMHESWAHSKCWERSLKGTDCLVVNIFAPVLIVAYFGCGMVIGHVWDVVAWLVDDDVVSKLGLRVFNEMMFGIGTPFILMCVRSRPSC